MFVQMSTMCSGRCKQVNECKCMYKCHSKCTPVL